jgi:hypothetical protein
VSNALTVGSLGLLRLSRRRWVLVALAAGVAIAVVCAIVAIGSDGQAREDEFRRAGAALLLLGGLAFAIALGSAALNTDAENGHFGMLHGAGASRPQIAAGAVGARVAVLALGLLAWGVVLQIGSAALGLGLDGPLAVHTLAVAEGLLLTLLACSAASSVVGPLAAGAFGVALYVTAQAAVNLKAAADQALIGTADAGVNLLYHVAPRTITSPMLAELQLRDAAGAAAPRVEINDNTVIIPASGWDSVVWTLAWCVLLALACAAGLRRRPLG